MRQRKSRYGEKGRVMFFLLRVAFWLSVVLVLLPSGQSQPQSKAPVIGAVDAVSAAGAAVSDMSHFCKRQPDACEVGTQTAAILGQRAQAGAKMIYEFLSEKMGPNETGSVPTSVNKTPATPRMKPSQHTLRPDDLVPAWRGLVPRKDVQAKRPA